jgi:hypothetical protein
MNAEPRLDPPQANPSFLHNCQSQMMECSPNRINQHHDSAMQRADALKIEQI